MALFESPTKRESSAFDELELYFSLSSAAATGLWMLGFFAFGAELGILVLLLLPILSVFLGASGAILSFLAWQRGEVKTSLLLATVIALLPAFYLFGFAWIFGPPPGEDY